MTKIGKGSNCFDKELLMEYYDDYEKCRCGKQATDWHHAKVRAGKFTNSILNASPVCRDCHNHHGILLRQYKEEIKRNAKRLHESGYKLTELDMKFIQEYNLLEVIKEIL